MPIPQQNSVFIDPEECGSSVGYYLVFNEFNTKEGKTKYNLSGNVILADCSHKIEWIFGNEQLEKIDAAIQMLQEFRKKYAEAIKMVNKLNR